MDRAWQERPLIQEVPHDACFEGCIAGCLASRHFTAVVWGRAVNFRQCTLHIRQHFLQDLLVNGASASHRSHHSFMPLAEFPRFSSLPREIQLQIWVTAARPCPGKRHVQFFIIEDQHVTPASPPHPVPGHFLRLAAEGRINDGFKLAVPFRERNSSVYMLDAGLWTACCDSKAAMRRAYPSNHWWPKVRAEHLPSPDAHTVSFVDAAGTRHITFRPKFDLFYFAPLKLGQVDWWRHYAHDQVPLISADGQSLLGPDVAVTYDPLMMGVLHNRPRRQCRHTWSGESAGALIDMVDLFHERVDWSMWFVDYRLRHRGTVAPSNDRERFYSQDCVFTEVAHGDMHKSWTMGNCGGNEHPETVFDMFEKLHDVSHGRLDLLGSDRMHVLACEPLPGKSFSRPQPSVNEPCEACAFEQRVPSRMPSRVHSARARDNNDDIDIDLEGFSLFD